MSRPISRVLRLAVRLPARVLLATAAVVGLVCLGGAIAAAVTGGQAVVVRSGSMEPALPIGSLAVLHPVPVTSVRVGDAASVLVRPDERVTHRIVAIDRPSADVIRLHLRGDANAVADPEPVDLGASARVQVVAFAVPQAGRAIAWLQGPTGRLVLLAYLGALVLILARGPATPSGPSGLSGPSGRGRRRLARGATATVTAGVVLASGGTAEAAAWTDPVALTGTSLQPVTPTPPTVNCPGSLGVGAITFTWAAVPNATSYTVNYGSSGSQSTVVTSPTITLNGLITGGKFSVRTNYNAWQSAASSPVRTYTVTLALLSTCS
ncbi:hypothetical protein GCM10022215_32750 [Nocardioides fonticola]|uniref:Signal peptidase I n=1 Tax=Nocardioides fonticola TaxID=450363 RepID=A0ABP7XRZ0_9ACTN